jgi:hypothetical protein
MARFVLLNSRWGDTIRSPSREDLERAIHEIFHEDLPELTDEDYAEHPNAGLVVGFEEGEGPSTTLDIFRGGMVFLTEAPEPDADPTRQMRLDRLDEAHALRLWLSLLAGRMAEVLQESWKPI